MKTSLIEGLRRQFSPIAAALIASALVVGCGDANDDHSGENSASGGSSTLPASGGASANEAGARAIAGAGSSGIASGGSSGMPNASGGSADDHSDDDPSHGGAVTSGGKTSSGGAATSGGKGSSGGDRAAGGDDDHDAEGGEAPTGEEGGAPSNPPEEEPSICFDSMGMPLPYDYSIGLASEYAFELSMSCDVGGYVLPLIAQDPEQLTAVNAFVAEMTDWYRASILRCADAHTTLAAGAFGLLPSSEAADVSKSDFDATVKLFLMVLDRHDGQPDGATPNQKSEIAKRLKSLADEAVSNDAGELTKTLSPPDCMPSEPPSGGEGGTQG